METVSGTIRFLIENLISVIAASGYWGIALGMAIESANIPLPSEIILPFGGYLVSTGRLDFFWAAMAGTLGGTAGSIASYWIGLWGGRPFLRRFGHYFGVTEKKLALAENWFNRYGDATVFFTRFLPVIRTFISLPAGIARMNFLKFIVYTFFGSLPWCFFLTYLGLKLGQNWQLLEPWFRRFDVLILAIIIILIFLFWIKRKKITT